MAIGNRKNGALLLAGCVAFSLLVFSPAPSGAALTADYMYDLSDFYGTIRFGWCRPYYDARTGEIYVATGATVYIFNSAGMEIYNFGAGELGLIQDISTDAEGNIVTLSSNYSYYFIGKCDYRGELLKEIRVTKVPDEFTEFSPSRMFYRNGEFVLIDRGRLRVAVVDGEGVFQRGYDLAPLIEVKDAERQDNEIFGVNLDGEGNLLFTVPVQFRAYRMSPEGKLEGFGMRGSGPGKFGVVTGIAADGEGNLFVADTLRGVVMRFDKDLRFLGEFGKRGLAPGQLIGPREVLTDGKGRLFVTQMRKRGISVFNYAN